MSQIDRLTPEQEALLPVWRDEWIRIGLSCEPCDLPAAKDAAHEAYRAAGLPPPELFFHVRSPLEAVVADSLILANIDIGDQVGAQVWDQVRDKVWAQVGARVRAQVRDQVWDQVRDQVKARVGDQVGDQIWDQVWAQVYGSHDAAWLGFYSFFGHVIGMDCCASLGGLMALARTSGWWTPRRGYVILQDRHEVLLRDERGRLHNETGPAVRYRDGFSVWAWHGVRVSRGLIESPDAITVDAIREESNAEIRRVMMWRYGLERFIRDSKATMVQDDGYGELYDITTPTGHERFVRVVNGTPEPDGTYRDYVLPTWPDVQTAHEAVARSYRLKPAEYHPVRT